MRLRLFDGCSSACFRLLDKPVGAVRGDSAHQIHTTQELVAARSWRFESSLPHHRLMRLPAQVCGAQCKCVWDSEFQFGLLALAPKLNYTNSSI